MYFTVSGGPFGTESAVAHAGALYTLLGFTLFPLLWSVPEALITAELATAYPEASGCVAWVTEAFGDRPGIANGYLTWLSGVADNSLYPALFLEYALVGEEGGRGEGRLGDGTVGRWLLTVGIVSFF